MSVRAFTQMNAAWTRGQSASAAAPPQKKTTSSYFRNHFNTWCKWPDSVLKHCYISLQVDQVWATFHPIHADLFLTHNCIPARSACFPSAYICVNTNPDTHMQAHAYLQSEYCSLSEKRCELIFHGPPLAESQSISQHSHMLDVSNRPKMVFLLDAQDSLLPLIVPKPINCPQVHFKHMPTLCTCTNIKIKIEEMHYALYIPTDCTTSRRTD